jgi:predicted lipoprotein with Yx(FWY)xxD motif
VSSTPCPVAASPRLRGARRRRVAVVAAAVTLVVAAGCGGDDDVDLAADRATTSTPAADAGPVTGAEPTGDGAVDGDAAEVAASSSPVGEILVDAGGRTLYLFTPDAQGASTCVDACADAWPPLLTSGDPVAGPGAEVEQLGTVERADGGLQVTYGGWPLYLFAGDGAAGDVTGQAQGGVWFVVSPEGGAVRAGTSGGSGGY